MLLTVFEGASSVEQIFILPLFGKSLGQSVGNIQMNKIQFLAPKKYQIH